MVALFLKIKKKFAHDMICERLISGVGLVIMSIMISGFTACVQHKKLAIDELEKFYSAYLAEIERMPERLEVVDSLQRTITSTTTLDSLNQLEYLSYDPFINAQDTRDYWATSVTVSVSKRNLNWFVIKMDPNDPKAPVVVLKTSIVNGVPKVIGFGSSDEAH